MKNALFTFNARRRRFPKRRPNFLRPGAESQQTPSLESKRISEKRRIPVYLSEKFRNRLGGAVGTSVKISSRTTVTFLSCQFMTPRAEPPSMPPRLALRAEDRKGLREERRGRGRIK